MICFKKFEDSRLICTGCFNSHTHLKSKIVFCFFNLIFEEFGLVFKLRDAHMVKIFKPKLKELLEKAKELQNVEYNN